MEDLKELRNVRFRASQIDFGVTAETAEFSGRWLVVEAANNKVKTTFFCVFRTTCSWEGPVTLGSDIMPGGGGHLPTQVLPSAASCRPGDGH